MINCQLTVYWCVRHYTPEQAKDSPSGNRSDRGICILYHGLMSWSSPDFPNICKSQAFSCPWVFLSFIGPCICIDKVIKHNDGGVKSFYVYFKFLGDHGKPHTYRRKLFLLD